MSVMECAPVSYKVPEFIIKEIAEIAFNPGIILIGGPVGCGKTNTINFFLSEVKDRPTFTSRFIFRIDSRAMLAAGKSVKVAVDELLLKNDGKILLVVIDDVYEPNAITAALALANKGHTVVGVSESASCNSMLGVLAGALAGTKDSEKTFVLKEILTHLNLLIQQPSHCPPEYNYLHLSSERKQILISLLGQQGLNYFFRESLSALLEVA